MIWLDLLMLVMGGGVFFLFLLPLVLTLTTFLVCILLMLGVLGLLFLFSPLLVAGAFGALLVGGKVFLLVLLLVTFWLLAGREGHGARVKNLLRGQRSGLAEPDLSR